MWLASNRKSRAILSDVYAFDLRTIKDLSIVLSARGIPTNERATLEGFEAMGPCTWE
jgi:hypothetical protein